MKTLRAIPTGRGKGSQAALEINFIEEYLHSQGQSLQTVKTLREEHATKLMKAACRYAGLKLAEVEARAGLRHKLADIIPDA